MDQDKTLPDTITNDEVRNLKDFFELLIKWDKIEATNTLDATTSSTHQ